VTPHKSIAGKGAATFGDRPASNESLPYFLLSIDAFIDYLAPIANAVSGQTFDGNESTNLVDDAGLDSLGILELLDILAARMARAGLDLVGFDIDVFEHGMTLRDLYLHCLIIAQRPVTSERIQPYSLIKGREGHTSR
jgi:hypothetical protein